MSVASRAPVAAAVDRARAAFERVDAIERRTVTLALGLAVVVAALIDLRYNDALFFSPDDAYITLHNAMVLKHGPDTSYVGVSALYGATSLLHLVVETLVLFVLPPLWTVWTVSWAAVVLYVAGLVRLSYALRPSAARAIATAALGITAGLTIQQLLNGLETGASLAAVAWALAIFHEKQAPRWSLPVLCAIMPLLRPELLAFALLLLALRVVEAAKDGVSPAVTRFKNDAAFFAVAIVPWMIFSFVETGHPVPSTMSAKHDFFAEFCLPPDVKAQWFHVIFVEFGARVGFVLGGILFLLLTRVGIACIVFAITFLAAFWLEFPGGLGQYDCRYMYVMMPMLIFGIASGASSRSSRIRALAGVVFALALVQSVVNFPERARFVNAFRGFTRDELVVTASWAGANLPADARVLVHDAGYISYGTKLRLVDIVGLKTPLAGKIHHEMTAPTCGALRAPAVVRIAAETGATHLIALRGWDNLYKFEDGFRQAGWRIERLYPAAPSNNYEIYSLVPPSPPRAN